VFALGLGAGCVNVDLPPRPLPIEEPGVDAGSEHAGASPSPDGDLPTDATPSGDRHDGLPDLDPTAPKDGGASADGEGPRDTAPRLDTAGPQDAAGAPDVAVLADATIPADLAPPADRASSGGTGRAGLIVGDANVLIPADTLARSRLQARGLTVAVIDELAASPSDAVDRDLIVISSSISSRSAAFDRITPFRGAAVPILCLAVHTCDLLGVTPQLGVQSGEVPDDDSINVTGVGHPLAAGLPAGLVPVMQPKSGEHWVLYWMNPHTTATRVASMRNAPSKVAIFGFEKGVALSTEQLAPARRVVFTLMPNNYNGNYQLNATGIALLDAAIAWAVQ
jgi:hypothetical protein